MSGINTGFIVALAVLAAMVIYHEVRLHLLDYVDKQTILLIKEINKALKAQNDCMDTLRKALRGL